MNERLKLYKQFIDDLVKIRPSVLKRWVKEKGWPDLPENKKYNDFLSTMSIDQKDIISDMIQQGRDGGIHDTLVYLSEQINIANMKIFKDNIELAVEPYGTELFWDWIARSQGGEWPEHQVNVKYKE
jgi:hypothetical protein